MGLSGGQTLGDGEPVVVLALAPYFDRSIPSRNAWRPWPASCSFETRDLAHRAQLNTVRHPVPVFHQAGPIISGYVELLQAAHSPSPIRGRD